MVTSKADEHNDRVLQGMIAAACNGIATNRPVTFKEFASAFRGECYKRKWTAELIPGLPDLRNMLESDGCAIWSGQDTFWYFDWHRYGKGIQRSIENLAVMNNEYSASFFYGKSRDLMRRTGVRAPQELYEILKCIYAGTGEEISFGDHLSIGFGNIDRQQQVRRFVAERPGKSRNILALEYQRKYGFSAGVVALWIDLFVSPEEICESGKAIEKSESLQTVCSTPESENGNIEQAQADQRDPAIAAFLSRELTEDICDAKLIRARFAYEFPEEPDILQNVSAFEDTGYYEDHGLLFKNGKTANEHFRRLLALHPSFSRGDPGFEEAVWNHPTFRSMLRGRLKDHAMLLYESDSYISFARVHSVLGMSMTDIESYAPAVYAAVPQAFPFTINSLREDAGFSHALDAFDMPVPFYESLLEISELMLSCTMAGTKVFMAGETGSFNVNIFLEWLVRRHEGIERGDVLRLLRREFGIDYPMPSLVTAVSNSTIYHDDVSDAYYSSMEKWKQEARNELA